MRSVAEVKWHLGQEHAYLQNHVARFASIEVKCEEIQISTITQRMHFLSISSSIPAARKRSNIWKTDKYTSVEKNDACQTTLNNTE